MSGNNNPPKSINSDWEAELEILEKNTNTTDVKEVLSATFKMAVTVLSFLPNKKSSSSSLTDGLYENSSKDGWQHGSQGYGFYMNGMKDKD